MYHSPNSAADNNNKLFNLIKDVTRVCSSYLLIIGDFNFPNIDLHSWTSSSDAVSDLFLCTLDDEFLIQHVSFSTRFQDSHTPSILDLIITRDDVQLYNFAAAPLGRSDHVMICFEYLCSITVPSSSNRNIYLKMVLMTSSIQSL